MFMRLLFITSNRIGDAILSTGILNYLLETFPDAQATVVSGPLAAPLFECFPSVKEVISFEKKTYGLHWLGLWKKNIFKKWDMIVDIRGSLVSYFLRVGKRHVWRPEKDFKRHRVEALAALLNLTTVPGPKIWINPEHRSKVQTLGVLKDKNETLIALGMGANWRGKTWRIENFIQLAEKIKKDKVSFPNAKFLLLGSSDERSLVTPFLEIFEKERVIDLMGKLDLVSVSAALKEADVFVGNDSGLMHLSSAVSTPTLGLFGPTRPEHYRPWGEKGSYVTTDLSYEDLISGRDYDPKTTDTLMDSLSVEKVFEALQKLRKEIS